VLFGVTVIVPVAFSATSTCQWNSIVECSRYSWCTTNCNGIRSKCCNPAGNPVAVPIPLLQLLHG
jgi:hypothetical protein